MTRFSLTALALVLAAPAFAGGTGEPAPIATIVAPAPSADWTGGYVGLQYDSVIDGTGTGIIGGTPGSADVDGDVYGIFGGYRFDFGTFVLGGELD